MNFVNFFDVIEYTVFGRKNSSYDRVTVISIYQEI